MSIEFRIDNNTTYILGRLESEVYQGLKKHLGYRPENAYFMMRQVEEKNRQRRDRSWAKEWDGYISTVCWSAASCKCSIKKQGTHFPTGLVSKALKFLKDRGVSVKVTDCRKPVEKTLDLHMSKEFEVRDYQQSVIEDALKTDRALIKLSTGGGKTSLASAIMAGRAVSPMIFYVTSIDLLVQAKNELQKFIKSNDMDIEVGELSGNKKDIKDITVMTVQTAVRSLGGVWKKYDEEDAKKEKTDITAIKEDVKKLIRSAKLIMCDEVQHWASETCQIISDNSVSARYRYALSATPYRDKGDDILIDACFGKIIADVNASQLIRSGHLVKPEITFVTIDNKTSLKKMSYVNIYKECIVYNEIRNNIISVLAKKMFHTGRNVLILCKQIAHGKLLQKLIPDSIFLHGEHSTKKRQKHLDIMRSGDPAITIASTIFDEGVDCKPLDGLILAGSGKSATRALQRIGRVLRPYQYANGKIKDRALVIDFMDNCKYMKEQSNTRLKMYRTEPEFEIKVM